MNALLVGLLFAAAAPTAAPDVDGAADPLAPVPALAPPAARPPPLEVYELHLAVDIPVTIAAGSVGLMRALFEDQLARKTCPCDPAGINGLDRGTVGNHS